VLSAARQQTSCKIYALFNVQIFDRTSFLERFPPET
jgi:hypothetical protein